MKKIIFTLVAVFSMGFSVFAEDVEEAWEKLKKSKSMYDFAEFSEASPSEAAKAGFTSLIKSKSLRANTNYSILIRADFNDIDDTYKVIKPTDGLWDVKDGLWEFVARQEDGDGNYSVLCYLTNGSGRDKFFVIMYGKMTESQLNAYLKSFKK